MAFEIFGAVSGVTQGVARLLGLSKSARLRRAINDDVKTYASLAPHDELKGAALELAGLIELQARQLALRELIAANRTYDWSQPIIGTLMAAICGVPLYLMFPPAYWWQWIADVLLGILAITLVASGMSGFRKQPKVEDLLVPVSEPTVEAESPPEPEAPSSA
jgi:hypothetical protein